MSDQKKRLAALIIEFDQVELACLIAEAFMDRKRPAGRSAEQAMASFDVDTCESFMRSAMAAMVYMRDQANAGRVPS